MEEIRKNLKIHVSDKFTEVLNCHSSQQTWHLTVKKNSKKFKIGCLGCQTLKKILVGIISKSIEGFSLSYNFIFYWHNFFQKKRECCTKSFVKIR